MQATARNTSSKGKAKESSSKVKSKGKDKSKVSLSKVKSKGKDKSKVSSSKEKSKSKAVKRKGDPVSAEGAVVRKKVQKKLDFSSHKISTKSSKVIQNNYTEIKLTLK